MTTHSPTKFGRYQIVEKLDPERIHIRSESETLKTVDHEPKVGVLDQEDLDAQGIDVSSFIPGAKRVDALGSCTAQTAMEASSNVLTLEQFTALVAQLGQLEPSGYNDVVVIERGAIGFYHRCTDQTGRSGTEWPPTDCGSSGPYIVELLKTLGAIKGDKVAHSADDIASLMQSDGCMWGTPWLNAWMEPTGSSAFIDGDGKSSTVQKQIAQGVAGGHEIYLSAIESIKFLPTGLIDAYNTVVRIRNHWDPSWGDHGSCRAHLSTLTGPLGKYGDIRQIRVA